MERERTLPRGSGERFAGYGVVAVPFLSGHILAFRRFVASSIGPAYRSVWHREPGGRWTFFTDVEPARSCPRFFGSAVDRVIVADIGLDWRGSHELVVTIPSARLDWCIRLDTTPATRFLNTTGAILPASAWHSSPVLGAIGSAAGRALRAGTIALRGLAPNGHGFQIHPRLVWSITAGAAILDGRELGPVRPLARQTRLADFWLPNRGIFAFGSTAFQPPTP
jgi:hypothetical protein